MHRIGLCAGGLLAAVVFATLAPAGALAQQSDQQSPLPADVPPEAWPTSPFHGAISGATGEPIPCRCRFGGSEYRLGATVCMTTHLGVQLARCDLLLNNTSWVPIGVPCTISRLDAPAGGRIDLAARPR